MTAAKGFVVPAGGGKNFEMTSPGRSAALKLLGHETGQSIMMFEETVPASTKSWHQELAPPASRQRRGRVGARG